MRVYVEVGGDFDLSISSLHVSVDLILQGISFPLLCFPCSSLTTVPQAHWVHPLILLPHLSSSLTHRPSPIPLRSIELSMFCHNKRQAWSLFSRASQNDYQDIVYLLMRYPQEIYECRAGLNQKHRRSFVEQYAARGAGQGKLKAAKHILGVA